MRSIRRTGPPVRVSNRRAPNHRRPKHDSSGWGDAPFQSFPQVLPGGATRPVLPLRSSGFATTSEKHPTRVVPDPMSRLHTISAMYRIPKYGKSRKHHGVRMST